MNIQTVEIEFHVWFDQSRLFVVAVNTCTHYGSIFINPLKNLLNLKGIKH